MGGKQIDTGIRTSLNTNEDRDYANAVITCLIMNIMTIDVHMVLYLGRAVIP